MPWPGPRPHSSARACTGLPTDLLSGRTAIPVRLLLFGSFNAGSLPGQGTRTDSP